MPNYKNVDDPPRRSLLPRKLAEYYYCTDGDLGTYGTKAALRAGSSCTLVEAGGQDELSESNFKNADVSDDCTEKNNTAICYCMQQCDAINECLAILFDESKSTCKLYNCAPDDMEWIGYTGSDNTTFMYMKSDESTVESMCEDKSELEHCPGSGCGTVKGPFYNTE